MILHILLKSESELFSFKESDFATLSSAHPGVELRFLKSEGELLEQIADVEFLDTWHFNASWYPQAPRLKAIFTPAAGQEYVQASAGVPIYFGKFHGDLMSETALGLMMSFSLRLGEYRSLQASKTWQRLPLRQLRNQKVMVLGYGAIGRVFARKLRALDISVTGVVRQYSGDREDDGTKIVPLEELALHLPEMDHVVSFLPASNETYHFISAEVLQYFSAKAYFYNFGRGTTVDEIALVSALNNRALAGAALDVTEIEPLSSQSDLWEHPDITLIPHASAYYEEYRAAHVNELTELLADLK